MSSDPACWPGCKSFASSNLDRLCVVLASVLRLDSPQEPAKDRTAPLRPITLRRPSQRLNHQNTKRKLRIGTVQNSPSVYSSSRKRKRSNLKRARTSKFVRISYIPVHFSLSWQLHIWTRGSYPTVHVSPSGASLTWGATSYSSGFSAKLLMHETTQRIAALERDLFCVASTGAFIHTFPVVSSAAFMIYFTCFIVHVQVSCSPTSTSG